MRKRHNTFRSLLAVSLLTIFTTSLFFGGTFAWFTDTSGVVVNTITMGEFDARVYMLEYDDSIKTYKAGSETQVTGSTMLQFYQSQILPGKDLVFEPGATFALPVLYVKNFSQFPINYKIRILRPTDAEAASYGDTVAFYNALKFYAKVGNTLVDLSTFEGKINAAPSGGAIESDKITIYVHMDENAGNEYNMNNENKGKVMKVSGIQVQFYLYQRDGAAGVGSAWYSSVTAGDEYRIVDTDPTNGSSVPGTSKPADAATTGKITAP